MGINTERLQQLNDALQKIDEDKRSALNPLIPEIVFMETRLQELRKLPHIRIHPKDNSRQEITAAGKQYKETMQAYLNAVKLLLTALYRNSSGSAADDLIAKLKEFEI